VDINSLKLPEATYDFALFVGSLHHIENLEYIFNELKKGLKPNSLFLLMNMLGHQFAVDGKTDKHIEQGMGGYALEIS